MAPTTFNVEDSQVPESEEPKITSLPTPARVIFSSLLSILAIALLSFPNPNVDFVKKCEEIAVRQGQNTSYCSQKYDSKIPPAPYLYTTLEEVWDEPICKGFQSSEPDQWLDPWTGWVLPGLSLLVMTPVAAKAVRRRRVRKGRGQYSENIDRTIDRFIPGKILEFLGHVKEWIFILGDPASAFCGTLAEMWRDMVLVKSHLSAGSGKNVKDRLVARICVLMAQVKYTEDTALAVRFLQGYSGSMPIARDAVRAMVGGRVRLLSTVVLPVVLYTGSAATVSRTK